MEFFKTATLFNKQSLQCNRFFPPLLISWYLKIRTEGKLCAQTNCQNIPFHRELTGNQFTHRNKYTNQHPLLKTTALPIICLSSSVPKVSQSNAAQHPKVVVGDRLEFRQSAQTSSQFQSKVHQQNFSRLVRENDQVTFAEMLKAWTRLIHAIYDWSAGFDLSVKFGRSVRFVNESIVWC